jgi:hypothetical protein
MDSNLSCRPEFHDNLAPMQDSAGGLYGYISRPDETRIVFNGRELYFSHYPQPYNGRAAAPYEELSAQLGFEAEALTLDNMSVPATLTAPGASVTLRANLRAAVVNGERRIYDIPVMFMMGTVYVQADILTDALGARAVWRAEDSTLEITL